MPIEKKTQKSLTNTIDINHSLKDSFRDACRKNIPISALHLS